MLKQKRPVFLNLTQIRLPITAIMSILHRLTGVLLFLALPLFVFAFDRSLQSHNGFSQILDFFETTPVRVILILLCWSMLHHLLAGIRYLFLDVDIGIERQQARSTAWLVILSALGLLVVIVGISL